MSRRSGQNGRIERKGDAYYARFWLDVPGKAKRTYKSVRIAPMSGPGSLNKFELRRRLKEIIAEFGVNSEDSLREAQVANFGRTFREQSKLWLDGVRTRKRRPVKPSTLSAWEGSLRFINANIGDMSLVDINNRTMKPFITQMAAEVLEDGTPRFSPKTISNYFQVVKTVVASALDEKDEPLYPVRWNADRLDLPVIERQNTPSFTAEEVSFLVTRGAEFSVLYAFLAGTGLRWGEASALRVEDVRDTVIHVRRSLWNGHLSTPKTENGCREVDIHSSLAEMLHKYLAGRTSGYVFTSGRGTPLLKSNVLRRSLHPILAGLGLPPSGFHAFRRFRVAHLRKQMIPEVLLRVWIGHSTQGITDQYALEGIKKDKLFRTMTAQKAGLGFPLPDGAGIARCTQLHPNGESVSN